MKKAIFTLVALVISTSSAFACGKMNDGSRNSNAKSNLVKTTSAQLHKGLK